MVLTTIGFFIFFKGVLKLWTGKIKN